MTISTASFYDRSRTAMQLLSAQADTLNTQISTGKKLAAPSDDAIAYSRLRGLTTASADDTATGKNLDVASALLSQADTALTSIQAQLQRASELAVQANTGTLSDDNRRSIATELDGIVQTIAGLADAKDQRGQPLFGGANGETAVTTNPDGTYSFAATQASPIPIGDGQSVQATETASRIFQFGDTDSLSVIAKLSAALKAGGPIGTAGSQAIADLQTATSQATTVQASLGARASRVDLAQSQLKDAATTRETLRSSLEDTDVTAAITELQKTMTTLQATQASFTKLQSLSLFDYLK